MADEYIELPPDIFYNPQLFDYTVGLPVWMWIILILVFVGVVSLCIMVYVWLVMKPVAGYGKVKDASTAKGVHHDWRVPRCVVARWVAVRSPTCANMRALIAAFAA